MQTTMQATFALALGLLPIAGAEAQTSAGSKSAPTPACALLSVAEVRKLTGHQNYPDHVDGDKLGEGLGGGSSCQYGGMSMNPAMNAPLLSVVLIPRPKGQPRPAYQRGLKLGEGCQRKNAPGVGDDAVIEACPTSRGPIVYASVGANDLLVEIDAKPPTDPAAMAAVIAVAKAAAANVK